MRQNKGRLMMVVTAMLVMLTLSGCKVPFLNIDLPTPSLPDFSKGLRIPEVVIPGTELFSADELRSERLEEKKRASGIEASMIVEDGYLRVGLPMQQTSMPLCYQYPDQTIVGIDVDLGAQIADELGLRVKYIAVTNPASALGKSCDVVMSVSSLEQDVKMAATYTETGIAFYRRGNQGVITVGELNGRTVGIQDASASQSALERTGLLMTEKAYADLNSAFEALESGQVDYVLCEAYAGAYLANKYEDINFAGCLEVPIAQGVAVDPDNAELTAQVATVLATIQANGIYDAIRHPWVGDVPQLDSECVIADIPAAPTATKDKALATDTPTTAKVGGNAVTN